MPFYVFYSLCCYSAVLIQLKGAFWPLWQHCDGAKEEPLPVDGFGLMRIRTVYAYCKNMQVVIPTNSRISFVVTSLRLSSQRRSFDCLLGPIFMMAWQYSPKFVFGAFTHDFVFSKKKDLYIANYKEIMRLKWEFLSQVISSPNYPSLYTWLSPKSALLGCDGHPKSWNSKWTSSWLNNKWSNLQFEVSNGSLSFYLSYQRFVMISFWAPSTFWPHAQRMSPKKVPVVFFCYSS